MIEGAHCRKLLNSPEITDFMRKIPKIKMELIEIVK